MRIIRTRKAEKLILLSDKKKSHLIGIGFCHCGRLLFDLSRIKRVLITFARKFSDDIIFRINQFRSHGSVNLKICKRIIFLHISQIVWLFIFSGVVQAESLNGTDQVSLRTGEFDSFRRILLTISTGVDTVDTNGRIAIPELNFDSQTGEFEISLFPIDTSFFTGETLRMEEEGAYPVRLSCVFPDAKTIIVKGKTVPFEKIIGYNIIGTNQYIFDIYKNPLPETDFLGRKDPSISEYGDSNTKKQILEPEDIGVFDTSSQSARGTLKTKGKGNFKKAFLISTFVILFGVFVFSILVLTPKFSIIQKWFNILRNYKNGNEIIEEDNKPVSKLSGPKKEQAIRRLMQEKGISYDEADIIVSISKRRINVKI